MHLLVIPFVLVGITSKIKHRKLMKDINLHLSTLDSINLTNIINQGNNEKVSGEILYAQRKGQD